MQFQNIDDTFFFSPSFFYLFFIFSYLHRANPLSSGSRLFFQILNDRIPKLLAPSLHLTKIISHDGVFDTYLVINGPLYNITTGIVKGSRSDTFQQFFFFHLKFDFFPFLHIGCKQGRMREPLYFFKCQVLSLNYIFYYFIFNSSYNRENKVCMDADLTAAFSAEFCK